MLYDGVIQQFLAIEPHANEMILLPTITKLL